jgi:hypothetical protein
MQTGELPDSEMVPEHNDERWLLEDREAEQQAAASAQDAAAAAAGGAARKKRKPTTGTQAPGDMELDELLKWAASFVAAVSGQASSIKGKGGAGLKLPLQLANNLLLTTLGRVEFVHPRFHNDKFIFPVGFTVRRRARTPLSGDKEVWHTAEVLADPQGAGPIFRWGPGLWLVLDCAVPCHAVLSCGVVWCAGVQVGACLVVWLMLCWTRLCRAVLSRALRCSVRDLAAVKSASTSSSAHACVVCCYAACVSAE